MHHPTPPHRADDIKPAYQLRYGWSAWPKRGTALPVEPGDSTFDAYRKRLETDGIRLLERAWSPQKVQIVVSTTPEVAPTNIAQRLKGRLSYELRQRDCDVTFTRNASVRAIGDTHSRRLATYIDQQVDERGYASAAFASHLKSFTTSYDHVKMSEPRRTRRGTYWYGLHVVLTTSGDTRVTDATTLRSIHETCRAVAQKYDHRISDMSVMPDHVHLALKPPPSDAPKEVGMSYLNNLCHRTETNWWRAGFYVGAFSEYDMNAVRG